MRRVDLNNCFRLRGIFQFDLNLLHRILFYYNNIGFLDDLERDGDDSDTSAGCGFQPEMFFLYRQDVDACTPFL
jgi:hypothetical protein